MIDISLLICRGMDCCDCRCMWGGDLLSGRANLQCPYLYALIHVITERASTIFPSAWSIENDSPKAKPCPGEKYQLALLIELESRPLNSWMDLSLSQGVCGAVSEAG